MSKILDKNWSWIQWIFFIFHTFFNTFKPKVNWLKSLQSISAWRWISSSQNGRITVFSMSKYFTTAKTVDSTKKVYLIFKKYSRKYTESTGFTSENSCCPAIFYVRIWLKRLKWMFIDTETRKEYQKHANER